MHDLMVRFGGVHAGLAKSSEQGTLLGAIATIAGAFLALYFTAYSFVVSALYPELPGGLGGRLIGEQVGNQYISAIVVLTGYSLLLLAFKALPGRPGVLNTVLVTLLAGLGIFCFYRLGRRAFHFFDPANLSYEILNRLYMYVSHSAVGGYQPFDINFQTHYQRMAASEVSALSDLISTCATRLELRSWSLASTVWGAARFLVFYSGKKRRIPSTSRWYEQAPRRGNWFLADYIKLSLAVDAQGVVQPDMVPSHHWLEDRLEQALVGALGTTTRGRATAASLEIVQAIGIYLRSASQNLDVGRARAMLARMRPHVWESSRLSSERGEGDESPHLDLAFFDAYGYAAAMVLLGLDAGLAQHTSPSVQTAASVARGRFYRQNVVPALLPYLEDLQDKLKLELAIEPHAVTPDWYVASVIAPRFLDIARTVVVEARELIKDLLQKEVDGLIKQGQTVRAAIHMQRGLELCRRLRETTQALGRLARDLDGSVPKKERPWPAIGEDGIVATIDELDDGLTLRLAGSLAGLAATRREESLPDFFGQAYETVCQSCFTALDCKNSGRFSKLFPFLLLGAMAAHDRVLNETADWDVEPRVILSAEPIRDVLAISGYARIYAELYSNPGSWTGVTQTWDKYLQGQTNRREIVEFLLKVHRFTGTGLRSGPRDMLRDRWEMRLSARLREMGLVEEIPEFVFGTRGEKRKPKHKSGLITYLGRHQYLPEVPAEEVFIHAYVRRLPEAGNIETEDRRRVFDLLGSLDEG
jgi:hypothetical protein